jgi:hypothetical protein
MEYKDGYVTVLHSMQRWHVLCSPPLIFAIIDQSGCDCGHVGAATQLSLAKTGNLQLPCMRTGTLLMISVWSDGLAPLPASLVWVDIVASMPQAARTQVQVLMYLR